ncbi:hypothetical protein ABT390_06190 [Streptomyces aurantiacus]|uniref:Pyrroline-5-carboxylate reductase catalytic N-terminal domain-containing protein n=1 Tax=Streptomyces aurantiacus JA 4570 TaxID=1286094 RepID=S3ZAR9_9ACTN|nr:hypothetical protein [Streptomyces aurantiacus]EPH40816.1 hypothetical protein STRAU_6140 [Streptomyces aurantiacus JA 4570]
MRQDHIHERVDVGIGHRSAGHPHPVEQDTEHDVDEEQNPVTVDRSEVVIIAVRAVDRHEALAGLRVPDDKIVVNVMSGVANDDLRRTLATDAPLVRAIPPALRT